MFRDGLFPHPTPFEPATGSSIPDCMGFMDSLFEFSRFFVLVLLVRTTNRPHSRTNLSPVKLLGRTASLSLILQPSPLNQFSNTPFTGIKRRLQKSCLFTTPKNYFVTPKFE
jgi:hypothetical protein